MSKLTGIPVSTLRYYDNEGLMPFLKRKNNNERAFTQEEYEALQVIECLKKAGLSIKDIKNFMLLVSKGNESLKERFELFKRQREVIQQEITKLHETLNIIEYKCWYYENAVKTNDEESIKKLSDKKIPKEFREVRKKLHCIPNDGGK